MLTGLIRIQIAEVLIVFSGGVDRIKSRASETVHGVHWVRINRRWCYYVGACGHRRTRRRATRMKLHWLKQVCFGSMLRAHLAIIVVHKSLQLVLLIGKVVDQMHFVHLIAVIRTVRYQDGLSWASGRIVDFEIRTIGVLIEQVIVMLLLLLLLTLKSARRVVGRCDWDGVVDMRQWVVRVYQRVSQRLISCSWRFHRVLTNQRLVVCQCASQVRTLHVRHKHALSGRCELVVRRRLQCVRERRVFWCLNQIAACKLQRVVRARLGSVRIVQVDTAGEIVRQLGVVFADFFELFVEKMFSSSKRAKNKLKFP